MGYRLVTTEQLGAIWAQKKIGESNRAIAQKLGIDRKTINRYVMMILELAIPPDAGYSQALEYLAVLRLDNAKPRPSMAILEPYEEEIRALIAGDRKANRQPMKAKTAWAVIKERHRFGTGTSYESFKRFVRARMIDIPRPGPTIRIETESGDETQIDYAKMGLWTVGDRNRVVYAFIGTLSFSRLPFVRFDVSQCQESFAQANVDMATFYGGTTRRVALDNLKSGVLQAKIYDPVINRTFAEFCDHYGIIADPTRPASPKDKGKVERIVQVVRELWKRLTALHPSATLDELNRLACIWSLEEYGLATHGTTGIPPRLAFDEIERACLRPLPAEPFAPSSWTIAKVHPDQFITVNKKLYALPATFIGKRVDVRTTGDFVEIFFEHKTIRRYTIPKKGRAYLKEDFPDYGQPCVPGAYASSLIVRAGNYGPQVATYLRLMLEDGGYLSIRRAQGCLGVIERYHALSGLSHVIGQAIAGRIFIPARLKVLFEAESRQNVIPFPASEASKAMSRDEKYYVGT